MRLYSHFCILLVFPALLSAIAANNADNRSFSIDYSGNTFLLDGKPFRYISGSLHYFRIHPDLWSDRMRKVRAAGFNAIQFYIQWNLHEPKPGVFNFEGRFDFEAFIKLAQKHDLFVLLRIGPYICGERDGGGLPFWLYAKHPDIRLRSSDPRFLAAVDRWWSVLLPKLERLLYARGGPVLMLQLENEYGNFGCDADYLLHLRDAARKHLGKEAVLYTTDNAWVNSVKCGKIPGVFATVDFGPGIVTDPKEGFRVQRLFEPKGPLVNSEFYPGWPDVWTRKHNTISVERVVKDFSEVLQMGGNINMYLVHGGTSFGFEAGSAQGGIFRKNHIHGLTTDNGGFGVDVTSYDFDAPISEAGDLNEKYFALKEVIKKYLPIPDIKVNTTAVKGDYGPIDVHYVASPFDIKLAQKVESDKPMTFDALGQASGFVLYETLIEKSTGGQVVLQVNDIHDRGYVFVQENLRGILSRMDGSIRMDIDIEAGEKLSILVENQGRINSGTPVDFKGITRSVTLGWTELKGWNMTLFPMDEEQDLTLIMAKKLEKVLHDKQKKKRVVRTPGFWAGTFRLPCQEIPKDSFLDFPGWTKGVAFLNGFNLGRYWPKAGPQKTLYVPGPVFASGCEENILVLFEQEGPGCNEDRCEVRFVAEHVINGSVTPTRMGKTSSSLFDMLEEAALDVVSLF